MSDALVLKDVSAGYDATVVLDQVSLTIVSGAALAVLGRNGVGKTTLLRAIMGHTTHHGGTIYFNNEPIMSQKPHRRARQGLGVVPQERDIFPSLTVEENPGSSLRAFSQSRGTAAGYGQSTVGR